MKESLSQAKGTQKRDEDTDLGFSTYSAYVRPWIHHQHRGLGSISRYVCDSTDLLEREAAVRLAEGQGKHSKEEQHGDGLAHGDI